MDETKTLFDGAALRDGGIERSVSHTEKDHPDWQDQAYDFLLTFLRDNIEFMTEDVRTASAGIVPAPPSKRA